MNEDWDEQVAVTGRPSDVAAPNTTLAERAASKKVSAKVVDIPAGSPVAAPKKAARKSK